MTHPMDHELLVRYWARDVSDEEAEAVELHVFACTACFEASSRVATITHGLVKVLPPVALSRDIERAEALGARRETGDFHPGVPREAWLRAGTDLLVHRLIADLEEVERVSVTIALPDGSTLLSFPDVPFEPSAGAVLIACQRHFVERFPPDVSIVVRREHRGGGESLDTYVVRHRIA